MNRMVSLQAFSPFHSCLDWSGSKTAFAPSVRAMRRMSTCQSVSVGALLSKWYMTILVLFTVVYGTCWCILNVWATLETKLHMDSSFSYARKIHVCLLLSSVRSTFNLNNVIVLIFSRSYWCDDLLWKLAWCHFSWNFLKSLFLYFFF